MAAQVGKLRGWNCQEQHLAGWEEGKRKGIQNEPPAGRAQVYRCPCRLPGPLGGSPPPRLTHLALLSSYRDLHWTLPLWREEGGPGRPHERVNADAEALSGALEVRASPEPFPPSVPGKKGILDIILI